jgi:hypothetical protein
MRGIRTEQVYISSKKQSRYISPASLLVMKLLRARKREREREI